MSGKIAEAFVEIRPDTKGFTGELQSGVQPGVKKIAGLLGGAFAVKGLFGFADQAVDAFAEIEDAVGAAGVTFGKGLKDVQKFAEGATDAFGLSEEQAITAAASFGTFGKSAGLAGRDLSGFSTDLAGLAADLASFKGTSTEEAIQAVGSALAGETEPLRRYGILLDDATLRQEALGLGLIKTTKEALTPAQKVLAAQAAITKQASDATGDFARTADSTANTAKRLAAESANLNVEIGQKLAPAFTAARRGVLKALDFGTSLGAAVAPALGDLKTRLTTGFADLKPDLSAALTSIREQVTGFAQPIIDSLRTGLATGDFSSLGGVLGEALAQAIEGAATAVARITAAFGTLVGKVNFGEIGLALGRQVPVLLLGLTTGILDLDFSALGTFISNNLGAVILGGITLAFAPAKLLGLLAKIPFVGPLVAGLLGALRTGARGLFTVGRSVVTGILDGLERSAPALIAGSIGLLRSLGVVLTTGIRGLVTRVVALFRGLPGQAAGALSGLPGRLGTIAGQAAGLFLRAIGTLPRLAVGIFRSLAGQIVGALGPLAGRLVQAGRDVISGFIRGITSSAGRVIGAIRSAITDKLPAFVKKALGINSPSRVFAALGEQVGAGMALGIDRSSSQVDAAARRLTAIGTGATLGADERRAAGAARNTTISMPVTVYGTDDIAARAVREQGRELAFAFDTALAAR